MRPFSSPARISHTSTQWTGARSREDKPRILWLDSICIDQRNVIEKNHQVRLMNKIYARSKGVVCWAGLELAREIEKTDWDKYPEVVDRFPSVAYNTLIKLMSRSYFRRQWVVQEIYLSEVVTIQFSKYLLPWSALAASAEGVAKFGRDQRASLDLDFLRLADHLSRDEDLPSWSPNWTHIWAGSSQIRSLKFQGWPPKKGRIVPGSDVAFSEDLRRLTAKSVRRFVVTIVKEPSTIPEEPPGNSIADAEVYAALATTRIQTEHLVTYTPRPGQTKDDRRIEFIDSLVEGFAGGQSVLFTHGQFDSWYEHIVTRTTDQLPGEDKASWCQYNDKFLKWLHEAQYFITDSDVVGVAERVTCVRPGDAVVSLKGASEDSLFAIRQLPAQQSDHILLNGVYIYFTPEETEAHKALVDDLNAGVLDTEKITFVCERVL
ncbi:hypothetical protein PspLS_02884 [Pyricularia sp. CBS 133598]|nr:hypothetical protein PspLS_02884 [Pyricularia sp. CBS 133598]